MSCYLVKVLVSLTKVYYSEELASQRSVGIVFIIFFFVCALGILLIDEGVLDFGSERSHKDIALSVAELIGCNFILCQTLYIVPKITIFNVTCKQQCNLLT